MVSYCTSVRSLLVMRRVVLSRDKINACSMYVRGVGSAAGGAVVQGACGMRLKALEALDTRSVF